MATGVVSRDTAAAREVVAQFEERFSLAGLGRRERRGVRVRQGEPEGDRQRPGVRRPGQRRPQGDARARSVSWTWAPTAQTSASVAAIGPHNPGEPAT